MLHPFDRLANISISRIIPPPLKKILDPRMLALCIRHSCHGIVSFPIYFISNIQHDYSICIFYFLNEIYIGKNRSLGLAAGIMELMTSRLSSHLI